MHNNYGQIVILGTSENGINLSTHIKWNILTYPFNSIFKNITMSRWRIQDLFLTQTLFASYITLQISILNFLKLTMVEEKLAPKLLVLLTKTQFSSVLSLSFSKFSLAFFTKKSKLNLEELRQITEKS